MKFFKGILLLTKKELSDNFTTPLTYVVMGMFSIITGWLFFNYLAISKDVTTLSILDSIIMPTFGNINFIFLFITPILTMKVFAEEKKMHTLEALLLSELKDQQIIFAKFISCIITAISILALTLIFPTILHFSDYQNWPIVLNSYLGTILVICCYISVGIFASSLTDNQMVAAIVCFAILLGIMTLIFAANTTNNYLIGQMLKYLSIGFHYEPFLRGVGKSYNFIYFISFISFFLHLTNIRLKARNW